MRSIRRSLLYAALLLSAGHACAQLADGLYRIPADPTGKMIEDQDGVLRNLGRSVDFSKVTASCHSLNNHNDRFQLRLEMPYDPSLKSGAVLVRGGKGFKSSGGGSSGEEKSSLSFYINSSAYAKVLTRFLNCELQLRRHPKHQFRVTFQLNEGKEDLSPGEEAVVNLRIENVGENVVAFWSGGRNRGSRNNQYVFAGEINGEPLKDHGSYSHFGGLSFPVRLEPGESFESSVDLRKWFSLKQTGHYTIYGSYFLRFIEPAEPGEWDILETLWEDYATASFSFRIKDK